MVLPSNNKVASSLSPMASGDDGAQSQSQSQSQSMASGNNKVDSSTEYQLRKYLLLLATLVATVTYVAGLNLPGGAWQEDTRDGRHYHHAGDPILQYAHLRRYLTFYYCNATAFAASLVVSLLLLVLDGSNKGWWEPLLRVVMVLDLLGLMGAYAAGSCRDTFTTVYSALLVCAVFAYVVVAFVLYLFSRYGDQLAILLHTKQRLAEALRYLKKREDQQLIAGANTDDTEKQGGGGGGSDVTERRQELHEVLMLLATFAVTITYVAGLNPPGGFWSETKEGHKMSDPVLQEHYSARYQAFYVCNTTAFVASLLIIILLLDKKLTVRLSVRSVALYGLTITALLGLIGAYAAGSCRQLDDTTYVICLIAGVLAYIFLQVVIAGWSWIQKVYRRVLHFLVKLRRCCGLDGSPQPQQPQQDQTSSSSQDGQHKQDQNQNQVSSRGLQLTGDIHPADQGTASEETVETQKDKRLAKQKTLDLEKERLEKARSSLVMLLATLVVSITYSAGMDPPGGLWPDTRDNHTIGDPILLTTHPTRYKVFFYSNSAAFVASLIVILMVQSRQLLKGGTLEAVMILDLFGLISAYAAGSCRDDTTSIYVVALAGLVLVYVVIHIVLFTLDHEPDNLIGPQDGDDEESRRLLLQKQKLLLLQQQKLEDRREVLLLLAILAATLTYQAGLTPPGGFWSEDKDGHRAGYPVLHDNYRPRYSAFFYCNAASFMASVALIVLLVNRNLYRPGIQCYALYVGMVVGMFGLMGAYAAGSSRDLRTSIYVLTLVVAVLAFIALEVVIFWVWPYLKNLQWPSWCCCKNIQDLQEHNKNNQNRQEQSKNPQDQLSPEAKKERDTREYLMLLGVLAASVTYQTGLKPPGGLWQDNSYGHSAGSSILLYINKRRYHAFFYCNSMSFMASVVVIILLLRRIHHLSSSDEQKDPESQQEQEQEQKQKLNLPLWPMHTAILLDMLGLLGAYAAGSTRDWKTSRKIIYLVIPVLACIAVYTVRVNLWREKIKDFLRNHACACIAPRQN